MKLTVNSPGENFVVKDRLDGDELVKPGETFEVDDERGEQLLDTYRPRLRRARESEKQESKDLEPRETAEPFDNPDPQGNYDPKGVHLADVTQIPPRVDDDTTFRG